MAFFRCDVMSESLGMATSVLVTMPDTGDLPPRQWCTCCMA